MAKQATVGVKDLCYAIATVATDGSVTYAAPKTITSVQKIGLSVSASSDKYYADDAVADIVNNFEGASVTIDTYGIDNATIAELEGHTVDENGVMVESKNDDPPYIALGFKSKKRNSNYRYVWLLLGKKQADSEEYETIKDKEEPKSSQLTFEFVARADDNWRYKVDGDDPTIDPGLADVFLTQVYDGTVPVV